MQQIWRWHTRTTSQAGFRLRPSYDTQSMPTPKPAERQRSLVAWANYKLLHVQPYIPNPNTYIHPKKHTRKTALMQPSSSFLHKSSTCCCSLRQPAQHLSYSSHSWYLQPAKGTRYTTRELGTRSCSKWISAKHNKARSSRSPAKTTRDSGQTFGRLWFYAGDANNRAILQEKKALHETIKF